MAKTTRIIHDPPKQGWIISSWRSEPEPVLVLSETEKTLELCEYQDYHRPPTWSKGYTRRGITVYQSFEEARKGALELADRDIRQAQSTLDSRKAKKQRIAQMPQRSFPNES